MKLYLVQAEVNIHYETIFRAECVIANSEDEAIKIACINFNSHENNTWAEEVCFENYNIKLEENLWKNC